MVSLYFSLDSWPFHSKLLIWSSDLGTDRLHALPYFISHVPSIVFRTRSRCTYHIFRNYRVCGRWSVWFVKLSSNRFERISTWWRVWGRLLRRCHGFVLGMVRLSSATLNCKADVPFSMVLPAELPSYYIRILTLFPWSVLSSQGSYFVCDNGNSESKVRKRYLKLLPCLETEDNSCKVMAS